jgi:hypothetical protein
MDTPPVDAIACRCGATTDDGEPMVACDGCGVWQHMICNGLLSGCAVLRFLCESPTCVAQRGETCVLLEQEHEGQVACVCGVNVDDGNPMIECSWCRVWQHVHCTASEAAMTDESLAWCCPTCAATPREQPLAEPSRPPSVTLLADCAPLDETRVVVKKKTAAGLVAADESLQARLARLTDVLAEATGARAIEAAAFREYAAGARAALLQVLAVLKNPAGRRDGVRRAVTTTLLAANLALVEIAQSWRTAAYLRDCPDDDSGLTTDLASGALAAFPHIGGGVAAAEFRYAAMGVPATLEVLWTELLRLAAGCACRRAPGSHELLYRATRDALDFLGGASMLNTRSDEWAVGHAAASVELQRALADRAGLDELTSRLLPVHNCRHSLRGAVVLAAGSPQPEGRRTR